MQTFLPFGRDFERTAGVLDRQRLLKQRVETLQIMNVLTGVSRGWRHHPAVLMWAGYESGLLAYQEAVAAETLRRGYRDTCLEKTRKVFETASLPGKLVLPQWLDDDRLIITHRGNLYRKAPWFYSDFFPEGTNSFYSVYACCESCSYFWPTHVPDYQQHAIVQNTSSAVQ